MNINHNRLVPGAITYWGDIVGDLSDQNDLVEYISTHGGGGGTEAIWGNISGTLSNQTDLMNQFSSYATQDWVTEEALSEYATESWVASQGYLTAVPSEYATESFVTSALSGYATQSWVGQQGYITSSALSGYATEQWVGDQGYIDQIKTVNNQSLIGEGNIEIEGLTQEQEDAIDPLVNRTEGYLHCVPGVDKIPAETMISYDIQNEISSGSTQRRVFNIGGEVYYLNRGDNCIYIYDRTTCEFNYHCGTTGYAETGNTDYLLWEDSQGRVYYYNQYKVDLDTGVFTSWNMGGDYVQYDGTRNSNLIQREGVTYLISTTNSCAYIFNEETQLFDSSIPVTGTFPATGVNFSRWFTEFDGHYTYDDVTNQVELVFHLEGENPYIELVNIETELFPHNWNYMGYEETTRAVFVHPVTINGQTDYYVMGYPQAVMFKLVNGTWQAVEDFNVVSNYSSNTAGAFINDMWFGYGYDSSDRNNMFVWNFGETKGIPELYRFDNDIQDRVENLEDRVENLEETGFVTTSGVQHIVDDMGCMKLVEKEGIDYPMVDRPDQNPNDQNQYSSYPYILGFYETVTEEEIDGDTVNTKSENYTYIDGGNLCRIERHYVDDGNGGWTPDRDYTSEPAWIGDGLDVLWKHDILADPGLEIPENYPTDLYYDVTPEDSMFGYLDEETFEFNGFKMDENYNLGKYKIEGVEQGSIIVYEETFIPYIAAEAPDTSTDATYVLKATVLNGEVTYEWVPDNVI